MERLIKYLIISFILLSLIACNHRFGYTKKQYIGKFEKFILAVEVDYKNFDSDAWDKANAKFIEFSELEYNLFKSDLTNEEQEKIDKLKGKYYSFVVKSKTKKIIDKVQTFHNQAEGFIEGFTK